MVAVQLQVVLVAAVQVVKTIQTLQQVLVILVAEAEAVDIHLTQTQAIEVEEVVVQV